MGCISMWHFKACLSVIFTILKEIIVAKSFKSCYHIVANIFLDNCRVTVGVRITKSDLI